MRLIKRLESIHKGEVYYVVYKRKPPSLDISFTSIEKITEIDKGSNLDIRSVTTHILKGDVVTDNTWWKFSITDVYKLSISDRKKLLVELL